MATTKKTTKKKTTKKKVAKKNASDKLRVHELARQLNMETSELLPVIKRLRINAPTGLSTVTANQAQRIRDAVAATEQPAPKTTKAKEQTAKKTTKKRRKKSTKKTTGSDVLTTRPALDRLKRGQGVKTYLLEYLEACKC